VLSLALSGRHFSFATKPAPAKALSHFKRRRRNWQTRWKPAKPLSFERLIDQLWFRGEHNGVAVEHAALVSVREHHADIRAIVNSTVEGKVAEPAASYDTLVIP